jgi:hypothetical protein
LVIAGVRSEDRGRTRFRTNHRKGFVPGGPSRRLRPVGIAPGDAHSTHHHRIESE